MNLPNKLTMLRVLMIPFFVAFMLLGYKWIALVLFVVASLTDLADGKIARRYNLITDFGKFMDPLADKMLVCSAMICLVGANRIWTWVVILIIAREFIISGFRLIAAEKGSVIAASWWGKFKTTFQMIMVIMMIIDVDYKISHSGNALGQAYGILTNVIMFIALALTIISLGDYLIKNWNVMDGQM
ncbi:CDP-diacylglycerol--glycerol-3-phosphate 3-phosphatidyltransferase [Butyrivibrio sp. NC3005]|uniref:CDP-diacylglycerol--glycerol-3-phosphate 3-phosphatidyltransferase n=1 Tax=Butyrivibrio sp. NC3005 TaxID=1280685 RepID=UPI000409CDF0|nr:CDP-diacylglycerol--glycerol-3-phosphate 3-phosphatidyltransferase [Butyrivibrio sp. NC3005]